MKTETHLKYARYLRDKYLADCSQFEKSAFVIGCVEPDVNLFSYLKGFRIKPFYGHNCENSVEFIKKSLQKLDKGQVRCFNLGRLVHYVCDAFTLPHNRAFSGGLREHTLYEKRLHRVIEEDIKQRSFDNVIFGNCTDELSSLYSKYGNTSHSEKSDSDFIRSAAAIIIKSWLSVQENRILIKNNRIPF